MKIDSWDDIRVALAVARRGTVSGAAADLGVHHATVIRRIDALEAALKARLFQRHPRGYVLTDAGRTLLKSADLTDQLFSQMATQIAGAGERIEGELIITAVPELADLIMPRLAPLLQQHENLRLTYITDPRLFRLSAGEAHIAVRAGARPTEPDYVVLPLGQVQQPLYASPDYIARYGPVEDPRTHRFALAGPEARNAPYMRWLYDRLAPENIILTASESSARETVIRMGLAIGSVPPSRTDGLQVALCLPEWESSLWLVTHVDLHRTSKVQAALAALRSAD
jgi:DNA-binding transcriptional LysR family regulator